MFPPPQLCLTVEVQQQLQVNELLTLSLKGTPATIARMFILIAHIFDPTLCSHYFQLVTIGESRNTYQPLNWEPCLLTLALDAVNHDRSGISVVSMTTLYLFVNNNNDNNKYFCKAFWETQRFEHWWGTEGNHYRHQKRYYG